MTSAEAANSSGEPRANSFDHLRLAAAFAVLVTHQYDVHQRPWTWDGIAPGTWAVGVFFAISGYLNTRSLLRRKSIPLFLASRALRIYPALIVCIGSTVVLGAFLTKIPLRDYFGRETFDYFWRNAGLFFGQRPSLPGVFEGNPVRSTNVSLWTLPIEARFYLMLAGVACVARYRSPAITIVTVLVGAYIVSLGAAAAASRSSLQLGVFFTSGIAFATVEAFRGPRLALGTLAVAAALAWLCGHGHAAFWISMAAAVVIVGKMTIPQVVRLPLDISYGAYLFAYPIQQLTVTFGLSFYPGMAVAVVLTAAVATLSALLVEQPALELAARIKRGTGSQPKTASPREPVYR